MVVKTVRSVVKSAGSVLDAEDRKVAGIALVLSVVVVATAGLLGLAIRVFEIAAG